MNPGGYPLEELDDASASYEQELNPAKAEFCLELLRELSGGFRDVRSVLDVGCGEGRFLDRAKDAGLETAGVEISERAAAMAQSKGHQIINRSIVDAPLPGNQRFDAVTMWDILEHLDSPGLVLKHLATALKPGGHLVVVTPMMGSVYDRFGIPLCKITGGRFDKLVEMCWGHDHVFRYHRHGVREPLKRMGFEQVNVKPVLVLSLNDAAYAGSDLAPAWTGVGPLDRLISRLGVRMARLCRLHNKILIHARWNPDR